MLKCRDTDRIRIIKHEAGPRQKCQRVNPFRSRNYPTNSASVQQSSREQRSPWGQQQVEPGASGQRAVWSDAPLRGASGNALLASGPTMRSACGNLTR